MKDKNGLDEKQKDNVTSLPVGGPNRQLRRVGTKIGRKVLPFQKIILRVGPLHLYRDGKGKLRLKWSVRRRR